MDPVIHTIGNGPMLRAALDAISGIFGSDAGLLTGDGILSVGAIGGVIVMALLVVYALKSLTTAKLEILPLFLVIVAYSVMFTIKTTVVVQDHYTNQIEVVDDVPIGVAYPGWVISAAGYYLTELTQTAYSNIDGNHAEVAFTSTGMVHPLRLLMSTRDISTGDISNEFQRSWNGYIRYCLAPSVASGQINQGDLFDNKKYLIDTFFDVDNLTPAFLGYWEDGGNEELKNCVEVANGLDERLIEYVNEGTSTDKGIDAYLARKMGNPFATSSKKGLPTGPNSEMQLEAVLKDHLGPAIRNNRDFIGGLLVKNTLAQGFENATSTDITITSMMTQALEQAKVDAAGAASQFLNTVFFTQGFFQFLFFAMAPFVALMFLVRGLAGGAKLLGSWLLLGIWSQLFFVTAAMINSYSINMVRELTESGGIELLSLQGFNDLFNQIGLGLLVANNGLASSGMIILVFLTGSIYSLNSLANQMTPRDTNPEEFAAPALASVGGSLVPGALVATQQNTPQVNSSLVATSPGNTTAYSVADLDSNSLTRAATQTSTVTESSQESINRAYNHSMAVMDAAGLTVNGSNSESFTNGMSDFNNLSKAEQQTAIDRVAYQNKDQAGVSADASATVKTPDLFGLSPLSAKATASVTAGTSSSQVNEGSEASTSSTTQDEGVSKTKLSQTAAMLNFAASTSESASDSENFSEVESRMESKINALSEAEQTSQVRSESSSLSSSSKMDVNTAANYMAKTSGGYDGLLREMTAEAYSQDHDFGVAFEAATSNLAGDDVDKLFGAMGALDGMNDLNTQSTAEDVALAANATELMIKTIDATTDNAPINPTITPSSLSKAAVVDPSELVSEKSLNDKQGQIGGKADVITTGATNVNHTTLGAVKAGDDAVKGARGAAEETATDAVADNARGLIRGANNQIVDVGPKMLFHMGEWAEKIKAEQPESGAEAVDLLSPLLGDDFTKDSMFVRRAAADYDAQIAKDPERDFDLKEFGAHIEKATSFSIFSYEGIEDKQPAQ